MRLRRKQRAKNMTKSYNSSRGAPRALCSQERKKLSERQVLALRWYSSRRAGF